MKRRNFLVGSALGLGLLGAALLAPHAGAQSGGVYSLKGTIASGGSTAGGIYRISSSIGLVTGGKSSGGAYTVQGELVRNAEAAGEQDPAAQDLELTPRLFLPFAGR